MAAKLRTAALLSAAFIALSGAAEPRRCYWCGPLAEQVHRSRRSAPCGGSDLATVCEPGYDYCAVVATSPPRVESRYCVKIYQDECYPLFCNSTKTWKMTCPCRGDLCNGPNTQRETEAFALLPKLVAKTHNARIKKRTAVATPHLIKHEKMPIIGNDDAAEKGIVSEDDVNSKDADSTQQSGGMQSDQPPNIVVEHPNDNEGTVSKENEQSTTANTQLIEIEIHVSDPTEESVKENEQPCTNTPMSSTNEPDKPAEVAETEKQEETLISIATTEAPMKITENVNVAQSDEPPKPTESMPQDVVTVKMPDEPHIETPVVAIEIMPSPEAAKPIDEMQNDAPIINPTDSAQTVQVTEEAKVEISTKNSVKPSEVMPTAGALQQNGSPTPVTEKSTPIPTEATTSTTTLTTQGNMVKQNTTTGTRRKNSATRITFSSALLLSCLVFL